VVLAQPSSIAWVVYDDRLRQSNMRWPEYRQLTKLGMVKSAPDITSLAKIIGVPGEILQKAVTDSIGFAGARGQDPFGRDFTKNPALNSELVKKKIEADIARDLTARGLEMTTGRSDLNVRYRFGSVHKAEIERYPAGWRGFGTRVVRVPYTEGTLVIDLRDPSTRSLVWRGIASEEKSDGTKIEGKLDDMVRKAIEKYPPRPK